MKNIILLSISFLFSVAGMAQQKSTQQHETESNQTTKFTFHRIIELKKHQKEEEILIKIEEETENIELTINTSVSSGKLTIEIYDANGKKQGTFSVGTQLTTPESEEAQGNITKTLTDPQAGTWKIKIIPITATGFVEINTNTSLK